MTKRQKFVVSSLLLTIGFFLLKFVEANLRYHAIAGLTILAAVLSFWGLRTEISKNATLLSLILPIMFTAGIGLFYFLLPSTLIVLIPVLIIYVVGIYALFLTSNIYTVAAARTIALLRAAHAVGFILTLFTGFLLFDTVFSLKGEFWLNGVLSFLTAFPLFLQGLWSIALEPKLTRELVLYASGLALTAGEIAIALSFWPITTTVAGLALTTVMYVGLGLTQAHLQQRLFRKTIREYLLVGIIIFLAMYFTARWGG